jgi:hypothetical protein
MEEELTMEEVLRRIRAIFAEESMASEQGPMQDAVGPKILPTSDAALPE